MNKAESTIRFEKGATLGRYELLEQIGEGGMGQVWRARDTNLDREVAIKHLHVEDDAKSRERFRREALILSRLSHPGVATIFDFGSTAGTDFLVMEYVPGGSLASRLKQGPLPIDQAIRYGIAIAEALQSAHQGGFLHRDLKPGNIVISGHDYPKILDFGIAGLLDATNAVRITQPGRAVGSLAYMSPQQLFGEADDVRADIYSLGVMLFEMVTGRLPFIKDRPEALMYAIVNEGAPSARSIRPDVPPALDRIIDDCMQKDPASRPASAAIVASALRAVNATRNDPEIEQPRTAIRAIAVLPLRNVSNDSGQDYFAEGMTEALISELSTIRQLRVISFTSAMKYKSTTLSITEIARELNVNAILEGSVLLAGDRVRINLRLVAARNEEMLWADRYDRKLENVLDIQSTVAESVAREIAIQLTPAEAKKLARRKTVIPGAHVEFLRSRHSSFIGSLEAIALGINHAQMATALDPESALAWASLADGYMAQAIRGMAPSRQATQKASQAALTAIQLDPMLADAHAALGNIQVHTGKVNEGIESLRKAIELNPGFALAHFILSRSLYALERHGEAIAEAQKAFSLDPMSVLISTGVGDAYYFAREYEKSVLAYRISLGLNPRFDAAHNDIARALEGLGRFDEARAAYEEGRKLAGKTTLHSTIGLAHIEAASGNEPEARRILGELIEMRATRVVSAWGIAGVYASLGDVDEAFTWLYEAVQEQASGVLLVRAHPRLDPIRTDPRYEPLLARLGLLSRPG
jgi:serine/threonine protein kinase/Flp pilus assembly protein TadD